MQQASDNYVDREQCNQISITYYHQLPSQFNVNYLRIDLTIIKDKDTGSLPVKLRSFKISKISQIPFLFNEFIFELSLTQICSLTRLSFLTTVFTLKSMPTVDTKAEVKESSAYLITKHKTIRTRPYIVNVKKWSASHLKKVPPNLGTSRFRSPRYSLYMKFFFLIWPFIIICYTSIVARIHCKD